MASQYIGRRCMLNSASTYKPHWVQIAWTFQCRCKDRPRDEPSFCLANHITLLIYWLVHYSRIGEYYGLPWLAFTLTLLSVALISWKIATVCGFDRAVLNQYSHCTALCFYTSPCSIGLDTQIRRGDCRDRFQYPAAYLHASVAKKSQDELQSDIESANGTNDSKITNHCSYSSFAKSKSANFTSEKGCSATIWKIGSLNSLTYFMFVLWRCSN